MSFIRFLFVLSALFSQLIADDYSFDLMDDIFDMSLEDLKEIRLETASKSLQTIKNAPARVVVITKDQIKDRGYRALDDLLNDLPAVQLVRYADSGTINQLGFRGVMGNNYFKILQDGIEIDQTDGEFMSVSMQYPLIGVERVEILYGAASVIYGADAMSAVINIVSSSDEGGFAGYWRGKDGYRYLYAGSNSKIGGGIFSIKAHYHNDQEYRFYEKYPEAYTPKKPEYAQKYDFKPHETESVHARYKAGSLDMGIKYDYSSESTLISLFNDNVGKDRNIFDKDANINSEKINAYIKHRGLIGSDLHTTTTLSYSSTEILNDSYFKNRFTGCKGGNYECMEGYQHSKSQKYGFEEVVNKELKTHDITAGIGFDYYDVVPVGYQSASKTGTKYYLIQDGKTDNAYLSSVKAADYHEKWYNLSLYLQDQITLNERLQIAIAARYDKNSNYESSFNPRLAIINPNSSFTQKLIYSQAFLAPSSNMKYKTYGSSTGYNSSGALDFNYTTRVANPDLEPERSKTIEYNLLVNPTKDDEISFSAYYTKIEDMISAEESLPKGYYDGQYMQDPKGAKNTNEATIYGADIGYNGRSSSDLGYWFNYSYIYGEVEMGDDKYKLPFVTSHLFKAGTTYKANRFTISPWIRYSSVIRVAPDEDVKDKTVDGYFLANFYASYAFSKNQKLSLRVDNLLDKYYYGVRYNSSTRYISPQDTRVWFLAYMVEF